MKQSRLYGLFEKQNDKWVRLYPDMAYTKSSAVRVFQNALLAGAFGGPDVKGIRELRVLPKVN
jgi:hypothetical protein